MRLRNLKKLVNKRNMSIFIIVLMLSSVFLSFTLYFEESEGPEKELMLIIDFGRGYKYPITIETGNTSVFDLLRSKVNSVHMEGDEIECINNVCNNENETWKFKVNEKEADVPLADYFPTGFDVIEFVFEEE